MKFHLTRTQRERLFAGECPGITGPRTVSTTLPDGSVQTKTIYEKCPLEPGDQIKLSELLTVTVLRVDAKAGGWKLHYEVVDRRDPKRLLRRTPPVVVPRGEDRPGEDEIKKAARESSYTGSARSAVPGDAGEAVDEQTQARFTAEARKGDQAQREREQRERKSRRLDERLRNVQIIANRKGIDLTRKLRRVESALEAAEREVGRDEA